MSSINMDTATAPSSRLAELQHPSFIKQTPSMKFHDANNSTSSTGSSSSSFVKGASYYRSTDETLSTANCDDSMTASACPSSVSNNNNSYQYSPSRLHGPPPVSAVNVDARGARQRLRDQEAKITALLHAKPSATAATTGTDTSISSTSVSVPAASEGILLKLVKTLEDDLKKTEAEKLELQEALDRLSSQLQQLQQQQLQQEQQLQKSCGPEDNDANDDEEGSSVDVSSTVNEEEPTAVPPTASALGATTAIPTGPAVSSATITEEEHDRVVNELQCELREKVYLISLLHERWETTLRRAVKYQSQLEVHDLHYTDYAARQMEAGEAALAELRDMTHKGGAANNKETRELGKKAKLMMSMLLNDLEALGERYQESRVVYEQQVTELREEKAEWERRVHLLEPKLLKQQQQDCCALRDDDIDDDIDDGIDDGKDQHYQEDRRVAGPLMSRHDETQEQEDLHAKVQASQWEKEQVQTERNVLQQEVQRLQQTVSRLQQVAHQQQDALKTAQAAATASRQQEKKSSKRQLFLIGRKKKTKTPLLPPAMAASAPPAVDLEVALAPMEEESRRFDMFHEQLQAQSHATKALQAEVAKQKLRNAQLQQALANIRLTQEQTKVEEECEALMELRAQLTDVETRRENEHRQAQAAIHELQARIEALR